LHLIPTLKLRRREMVKHYGDKFDDLCRNKKTAYRDEMRRHAVFGEIFLF